MRLSLHLIALVAFTLPVDAATIPTYSYFYPCDSGLVDCEDFPKHGSGTGGFSYGGKAPEDWPLSYFQPARFEPYLSNSRGEFLGSVSYPGGGTEPVAGYGFDGRVLCVWNCGVGVIPLDINEDGLQLHSTRGELRLGYGTGPLSEIQLSGNILQQSGLDGFFLSVRNARFDLGLSDKGQFVGRLSGTKNGIPTDVVGVFSPTPIPEPATFLLTLAALALMACQIRKIVSQPAASASAPRPSVRRPTNQRPVLITQIGQFFHFRRTHKGVHAVDIVSSPLRYPGCSASRHGALIDGKPSPA